MTKKFLKEWGIHPLDEETRHIFQTILDGGCKIVRDEVVVCLYSLPLNPATSGMFSPLESPGKAVKFAAALNKLRRPMHLIRQDLDADWSERVKARDNQTCALCGVQGAKVKAAGTKDALTAHHWLKTKSRAGMARWARACGVTVHFAEHIHTLHENPCWMDLEAIYGKVLAAEDENAIVAARMLTNVAPTEAAVRALWLERCGKMENTAEAPRYHPNPPREFS